MHKSMYILLFFIFLSGYAQEIEAIEENYFIYNSEKSNETFFRESAIDSATIKVIDPYYREDQFYLAITYNLLQNRPSGVSQNAFSSGLRFGFLRDMPINKNRTYSIAVGFGYSINNLRQTLMITRDDNGEIFYMPISKELNVSKNKLVLHYIELPIEFRWRTSTFDSHKFWRIYSGLKLDYLAYDRSIYHIDGVKEIVLGNKDLNKIQYGIFTSFGYNTWNFHIYYGLNSLFKSGEIGGRTINITTLNFGLMFYIL